MSGEAKAAMGGKRRQRIATATTVAAPCRPLPPFSLPSIAHPPDLSTGVVTDQQGTIRQHQQPDRPAPACAVGTLPTHDEVIDAGRAAAAAVHLHPHHFRSRRHGAIPRAVERHERVTAIVARKLRARIEREAERRGMRLHGDYRRLDVRTVGRAVFGIRFAWQIALRPTVVAPVFDDVDVLGGKVVAEVVAVVVVAPELAGRRIERHADGVAQALRENAAAGAVRVELHDRGPHRVSLIAEIARRSNAHVHLAVGGGPKSNVRVECPVPPGSRGTTVTGVPPLGLKRTTSRSSATYSVSPRNANPNGPCSPLTIVVTVSATPSLLRSASFTTSPELGCEA